MARLVWSRRALLSIGRLRSFLSARNPDAARRAVRTIRRGVRVLAVHPEIKRPCEGLPPGYREWWIRVGGSGYLALYRHDGESVSILAVRHAREVGN